IGKADPHQRAVPVAAVEDFVLVHDDLVREPVRLDIGDKGLELGAIYQREDVSQRVGLDPRSGTKRRRDLGLSAAHHGNSPPALAFVSHSARYFFSSAGASSQTLMISASTSSRRRRRTGR